MALPGDAARFNVDGCIETGALTVRGSDASLVTLARLRVVRGTFEVRDTAIVDFTGCEQLVTIGGTFAVRENASLTSFAGLDNLVDVGGFDIRDNEALDGDVSAAFIARF